MTLTKWALKMKLRDILSRSNPLDLPMTAGTFAPSGMDEAGNRTFKDILGRTYAVQPKPAMTMDEFWARSENMRAPKRQAPPNVGKAIVDMLTSGFTAPGRALAGESVTLGDVLDTAGTATLGAAPMRKPAGALGANSFRAYHGSPHSFDKFSMDKIGTGEGAQAYGHGLYFSDSEDVAKTYRENLSWSQKGAVIGGREYRGDSQQDIAAMAQETGLSPEAAYIVARYADAGADHVARVLGNIRQSKMEYDRARIPDYEAAVEFMRANPVKPNTPGSMYEVQINADPETFLDWDKPLSEQPQAVRDALDKLPYRGKVNQYAETKGPVYGALRDAYVNWPEAVPGQSREMVSADLGKAGIPGIKYFDAGSRGAGDGYRNYVVFDDALIEILRKYGLAGMMVGGGAAATLPPPATDNAKTLRDYLGAI